MTVFALSILVNMSGFGQNGHADDFKKNPEMRMEKKVEKLWKELELTEQQVKEVKLIFSEAQSEKKAIKEEYPSLKAAKEEMKGIQELKRSKMKTILTDEQQEMMKVYHHEFAKNAHPSDKKRNKNGELTEMKERLNLSDEQVAEIKDLHAEMKEKKRAIHEKYPELKEAKIQFKEVKKSMDSKMKAVLTHDQYSEYQGLTKVHHKNKHPHSSKRM